MGDETNKYKFDNLQPITFLRKFNKMVDEDKKHPLRQNKNQLKIYPLSKFPLPPFYYKMEGIFETGTKKKDIMNFNFKSKDDIQDQQFLAKHRNFMSKAIQKIIRQNQSQQQNLQKYKVQYNNNRKVEGLTKKSASEPKFKSNSKMRSTSGKNESIKEYNTIAQKPIEHQLQQMPEQNKNSTYLQKIQTERLNSLRNTKKQKIKFRQTSKIDEFIDTRKNFLSSRASQEDKHELLNEIKTGRTEYNNMTAQDWKKSFVQGLFNLQKQQNSYQQKYSHEIELQIKKFNQKADSSIEKTKKQKFW